VTSPFCPADKEKQKGKKNRLFIHFGIKIVYRHMFGMFFSFVVVLDKLNCLFRNDLFIVIFVKV